VLISCGALPPASNATATASNSELLLQWDYISDVGSAKATDKALIAVINSAKGEAVTYTAGAKRSAKTQTVALPANWSGDETLVYLGFISQDGREIANNRKQYGKLYTLF
jgi:hypothetical protein